MSVVIVWKAYKDALTKVTATTTLVKFTNLDKFALQTFNRLAYKQEVSQPLVISCLLGLLDHYSHNINVMTWSCDLVTWHGTQPHPSNSLWFQLTSNTPPPQTYDLRLPYIRCHLVSTTTLPKSYARPRAERLGANLWDQHLPVEPP